jgi:hypothetical protein
MVDLFLVRQPETREASVADAKGSQGYLSKLYLNDMILDAVERAQGYVRLPIGAYQLQMYRSSKHGNILRPLTPDGHELTGKKNKIRIHPGSIPSHVEGCIAPGFRSSGENGLPLHGSRTAFECILAACGEWQDRKIVGNLFVLRSHMPPTYALSGHLLDSTQRLSLGSVLPGL